MSLTTFLHSTDGIIPVSLVLENLERAVINHCTPYRQLGKRDQILRALFNQQD